MCRNILQHITDVRECIISLTFTKRFGYIGYKEGNKLKEKHFENEIKHQGVFKVTLFQIAIDSRQKVGM